MENWQAAGFGIYVHWPFCAAKCPYCDFNSHVTARVDHPRWRSALLREIDYWAERTEGRVVSSIFFGGGTPSLMEAETVAAVIERIKTHWRTANDIEVTLEANPTSVEAGRFRDFVGGGVNRFSVGMQALNDADLKALGRLHTVAEARRAYDVAREICDRVSFDLIYARQHQSLAAWTAELAEALRMEPDHLSLYQLTIEDGTAFGARAAAGKLAGLPSEDLSVALFEATQEACALAGLPRYEVSNHAKIGQESRHNLIYWHGGDWLGIGPGAHGRVTLEGVRTATETAQAPGDWLTRVERDSHATTVQDIIETIDIAEEYLIMCLRLRDGIDLQRLERLGFRLIKDRIQCLIDSGLIQQEGDHLRTTEPGVLLLNQILPALLPLEPL